MADTNTTRLNLTKPEVGASSDTWGTKWNTNADTLDALFDAGPAVKVANGGTGATTASAARTNLGLGTAATQNTGTSGATVPLLNAANTWSMSQTFTNTNNTFGNGSGEANIIVNGAAGVGRNVIYRTNGSNRWATSASTGAETGSNAGSDYAIARYTDAGAYIDTVLVINRASGATSLKELSLTTDLAVSHGGTGASDAATARTNLGLGSAATYNTGTSGANVPLLNGANTWSSSQTFSSANSFVNASGGVVVNVDGAAASTRAAYFKTAGLNRWVIGANATSEAGSNAGSDFFIYRYNDAGVFVDAPFSLNRATGVTTLKELNLTTALAVAEGGTGTTTATGTGSVVRAASPALLGTPTAPTAAAYTNGTQIATTAQVYATVTNVPINYQTVASYTLAASDRGKMVQIDNVSGVITVPSGVFSTGDRIDITQMAGTGQVTISAGAGMTLFSSGSKTKLSGQFSAATLHFWDGSRAQIIGDLA